MCLQAQQRFEKGLSPDHPSTLNTINKLGNLYREQRKLVDAEKLYQRALQGYEKALDPEIISHQLPALNTAYNVPVRGSRRHLSTLESRTLSM